MSNPTKGAGPVSRIYWWFSERDRITIYDNFMRRRSGIRKYQMLKGFLTAIALTPKPPSTETWLRRVWNHAGVPSERDQKLIARLRDPILRLHETIVTSLEPQDSWYGERHIEWEDGYLELELNLNKWCLGFIYGMQLAPEPWARLDAEQPTLLRPVRLFGTRCGLAEWYRMYESSPQLAESWFERIAPMVIDIRNYWRRSAAVAAH